MVGSVMNSGVQGIQRGYDMLNRSADQIAKANIPPEQGGPEELYTPMTEQISGKVQVQASAKVVEAASETLGTLIDIKV
ncbi:Flagellar hook protein FlgE [Reinekea sp. MED297]|uniref:Flagellar hook protein FlgE n=2 Tax=Reinekea TaxID=230494 RepID=A4BGD9_9GAMM|nr:Flagellar hook protein FlgE [Reinekea sp. MED297] [Reinekea blandensis MED297]